MGGVGGADVGATSRVALPRALPAPGRSTGGAVDLLGLRLPVQFIGGTLLDGVTTVTPSVRYLAFRAWLIHRYGQTGRADSWQAFTDFAARIAFFDGEECKLDYGPQDGFHGSRRMARRFSQEGRAGNVRGVIVADMVGDEDLRVALELMSYLRLHHQVAQVRGGLVPDNQVAPRDLTDRQRRDLKDAFAVVRHAQQQLSTRLSSGFV